MYIEPNTVIRILKDCPLDTTYEHTIYFTTAISQERYFEGLTKYTLTQQTYQRVNRGKMRVAVQAENLYDCNYLMFQNSSFGSKWFYAFIKSVEYVNNVTSEIEYEIDVMQTWFFNYDLEMCFVEREHSATDNIGDNLVPENLELGEYIASDFDVTGVLGEKSIVVASTFTKDFVDVAGGYYSGIFSGVVYNTFPNTYAGGQECANFIGEATRRNKSDGIVSVFLMPTSMLATPGDLAENNTVKTYNLSKTKKINNIGGYTPKNNKLFTYPYNFLYVTNLQGNHAVFPYEYFIGDTCTFVLGGDMSCNPQVVLVPTFYKGVSANYDEKMVLSGYPQLSYNIDTFKAWLAQNGSSLAVNALSTGATMVGAATTVGGAALAAAGAATPLGAAIAVGSLLAPVISHAIMPNQARGGGGSQTLAAMNMLDFAFMHKHITPEFACIIDNYFTKYGYATHRVKVPNRSVRPHWTYTKTVGCEITGSIPCDDARKICGIYDKGITFWKSDAIIGNYNQDNSV